MFSSAIKTGVASHRPYFVGPAYAKWRLSPTVTKSGCLGPLMLALEGNGEDSYRGRGFNSKRDPRFTEEEKLAIVKEGEKTGVKAVCAKYGFSDQL